MPAGQSPPARELLASMGNQSDFMSVRLGEHLKRKLLEGMLTTNVVRSHTRTSDTMLVVATLGSKEERLHREKAAKQMLVNETLTQSKPTARPKKSVTATAIIPCNSNTPTKPSSECAIQDKGSEEAPLKDLLCCESLASLDDIRCILLHLGYAMLVYSGGCMGWCPWHG